MSTVELIEYALRDAEVPMSDMLARALEQIESDLATAEQDSRQKQARIERLETALGEIAAMEVAGVLKRPGLPIQTALIALGK